MTDRLRALNRQLAYVADRSPFLRELLAEAGVVGHVDTLDAYLTLPALMDKTVERHSLDESERRLGHPFGLHLCADPDKLHVVLTTSGTTGPPTWYLFTEDDWQRALSVDRAALGLAGIRRGDRAVYAFASGGYIATIHVHALRRMGVVTFEAGAHLAPERLAEMIRRLRPTVILGTPTTLSAALDAGGPLPSDARARVLICGGEAAAAVPQVRSRLEEGFGGRLHDIFGPVSGNMFVSCGTSPYTGLHFVSPAIGLGLEDVHQPGGGQLVAPADRIEGELYYTALRHEAAPLVKYASGDVVSVDRSPCPCGAGTERVFFHGRVADMVAAGDARIGPWHVREEIASVERLSTNIRVVRPSRPNDRVRLLVESLPGGATVADGARLKAALEGRFRVPFNVRVMAAGSLTVSSPKTVLTIDEADADRLVGSPDPDRGGA